jgi:nucleotide-binding universal stress UspA family protein
VIVAGVDGSEGSLAAARWALAEARRRGAELRLVHVWGLPNMAGSTGFAPVSEPLLYRAAKVGAETMLHHTAAKIGDDAVGVTVESQLVEASSIARALIELSREAELLVLGSRGHGGFASLLLGSVSQEVAAHAHCPVVIIPPAAAVHADAALAAAGRRHVPVNWDFFG